VDEITLGSNIDGGTFLIGEFETSYAKLLAAFGEPNAQGDKYKVSTEWNFVFREEVFTVYDWKETSLYDDDRAPSVAEFRALPSYAWHIGGHGKEHLPAFLDALKARIDAAGRADK
jgi:hypothetical protein